MQDPTVQHFTWPGCWGSQPFVGLGRATPYDVLRGESPMCFWPKGPHTWHRKRHARKGLQTLAGKEALPAFRNWLENEYDEG